MHQAGVAAVLAARRVARDHVAALALELEVEAERVVPPAAEAVLLTQRRVDALLAAHDASSAGTDIEQQVAELPASEARATGRE